MSKPLRKTKIVATIGPASNSPEMIRKLIQAGTNIIRLNLSHATHEELVPQIENIHRIAAELGVQVAILADLQGPKIRTGKTVDNQIVHLEKDHKVWLTADPVPCDENTISISYPPLIEDLCIGDRILVNDGLVGLEVAKIDQNGNRCQCRVLNSGWYSSRKGVNFPLANLSVPALTEKDLRDLDFILTQNIHYIALSFVRTPDDLAQLREIINKQKKQVRVIAKIEKPEAAMNIDGLLYYCDGIMVARGDLGVETSLARMPIVQKELIQRAKSRGKSVIVATQMLESMIENLTPTRAEATDVANAILDGTDAVMLSGESAMGKYPVEAVETMARIAEAAEQSSYYSTDFVKIILPKRHATHAVCQAAATAAKDLGSIPVIVFTLSGSTAWYLSNIRGNAPLFAFSPVALVVAQLSLAWNTQAFQNPFEEDFVKLVQLAEKILLEKGMVEPGDQVVVVGGTVPMKGATNIMRIKRIGE